MGLITKINGLTYANTAKYSGVTKVNTKKVLSLFRSWELSGHLCNQLIARELVRVQAHR